MENTANKFAPKGRTKIVQGTILTPELAGLRLVLVPCSVSGKPDTDLYGVLDRKWKAAKVELKGWFATHIDFKLGNLHTTATQSDTWCIHALCMDKDNQVDEKALVSCIKKLADMAKYEKASVHVSTLVTDAIPSITDLLTTQLLDKGINVYFYKELAK